MKLSKLLVNLTEENETGSESEVEISKETPVDRIKGIIRTKISRKPAKDQAELYKYWAEDLNDFILEEYPQAKQKLKEFYVDFRKRYL